MPPAAKNQPVLPVVVNPLFSWFVWINLGLCVATLGVMVWVVIDPQTPMPKVREDLYRTCATVFKMTAGAFLGLMAGYGTHPKQPPT